MTELLPPVEKAEWRETDMKKKKADVAAIIEELKALYPDGICSLDYRKDYELLFSVRLAAQCTDERVNKVTLRHCMPAFLLWSRWPMLRLPKWSSTYIPRDFSGQRPRTSY